MEQMASVKPKPERRCDLDWLRVLAVLLLVPFHSALMFSLSPGDIVYVKAQVESPLLIQLAYFVHQWHMPLLFLIAGASTWFALQSRSGGQYLSQRFTRLAIPWVFGVTVLIPPMIYLYSLGRAEFESFWQFTFQFFRIDWNDLSGYSLTFTPGHLWFTLFLFVYSVVALPLFLYLGRDPGRRLIAGLATFFERPGRIFLLALPLAIAAALPDLGGMPPFLYLALFLCGYLFMADARFQHALDRHVVSGLVIGIACTVLIAGWGNPFPRYSVGDVLFHTMYYLSRWCWVIVILGLGHRFLSVSHRVLRYANEASYPFYILHLLVNTAIGYVVLQWNAGITVKYLVIVGATIAVTLGLYEALVRHTNVTRVLFGLKPQAHRISAAVSVGRSAEQEVG